MKKIVGGWGKVLAGGEKYLDQKTKFKSGWGVEKIYTFGSAVSLMRGEEVV